MDLIDRAALIESMGLENAVKWGNKDGYQRDHSYSTMMRYEIKYEIDAMPTIEAVPLDALCNWLAAQEFRVCGEPIVAKLDAETWANVIRECVMREA